MRRRDLLKNLGMTAGGMLSPSPLWARAAEQLPAEAKSSFATPRRGLVRRDGALFQPISVKISAAAASTSVVTTLDGLVRDRRTVSAGETTFDVLTAPVDATKTVSVSVDAGGAVQTASVELKPVRKVTVYILPHSHHDLGYTDLQADVEEKQMRNITRGMELAKKTASYPEGSRFVWNLEVLWGADLFTQRRSAAEKTELLEAIQKRADRAERIVCE